MCWLRMQLLLLCQSCLYWIQTNDAEEQSQKNQS